MSDQRGLRSGETVLVDRAASVQFSEPLLFRVIRILDWATYDGWAWLDGYVLDRVGLAVERRTIFVQPRGLRRKSPQQRPVRLSGG